MTVRKKNILLLIPTFADEGGTQKMVYELGKILAEKYNVFECSYDAFGEPHIFKNSNQVLTLNSPHSGSLISKLTGYPRKIKQLREIKRKYKIDITISNLWSADLINILSGTNDKTLSISHSSVVGNEQSRLLLKFRKLGKLIYSRFDRIVAVNEALMHELIEVFDIPVKKIGFINNFIAFPIKHQFRIKNHLENKRLVNVGRLHPGKNLDPLLTVFKNLKSTFPLLQLVLVGNGPSESQLKASAVEKGLLVGSLLEDKESDVIFTGFIDPYEALESSDIFVFPSKSEGLPLVLVEAMYTGLPIVTSDCPTGGPHVILEAKSKHQSNRREIEKTKYGFLMPIPLNEDIVTLQLWAQVISRLLKNEEELLELGKQAKLRSLDFSVDKIKAQWFKIIEEIE